MNILVLAGGRSTRFGRDKRLVDLDGQTLLDRTLRTVSSLGLPVFLATARDDAALPSWPHVARLRDRAPGLGPLAGVVDGLDRLGQDLLCVAADLPGLTSEPLRRLLDVAGAHPHAPAVVPRGSRGLEPLCAVYRPAVLPFLRDRLETGQRGLQDALKRLDGLQVVSLWPAHHLHNLNRAGELASARRGLRSRTDVP